MTTMFISTNIFNETDFKEMCEMRNEALRMLAKICNRVALTDILECAISEAEANEDKSMFLSASSLNTLKSNIPSLTISRLRFHIMALFKEIPCESMEEVLGSIMYWYDVENADREEQEEIQRLKAERKAKKEATRKRLCSTKRR